MINLNYYRTLKRPRGYVYLLQAVHDASIIKIGCTINPKQRLLALRNETPFQVEYLAIMTDDNMLRFESDLHHIFKAQRIEREFYLLAKEHVELILFSRFVTNHTNYADVIQSMFSDVQYIKNLSNA